VGLKSLKSLKLTNGYPNNNNNNNNNNKNTKVKSKPLELRSQVKITNESKVVKKKKKNLGGQAVHQAVSKMRPKPLMSSIYIGYISTVLCKSKSKNSTLNKVVVAELTSLLSLHCNQLKLTANGFATNG
jgi:hypothetical protein